VIQRILHFAQDSDTSGFFPQLAQWHDRSQYRMLFATLNPMARWLREYMQAQEVQCFSCDCQHRAEYLVGMLRLARFLRRARVDIVHTHLFEPSVIGLLASVLARTRTRVMTRHYSDYLTRAHKQWHVRLDQLCLRLCHGVIAVSHHTAEHLISAEHVPREKLHVVWNGIDCERVKLSGADARERVRREFATEHAYLLLIVARLHPEKGYEYLFEALPKLKQRLGRPFLLLVAGTGPFADAYHAAVRSLGCADVVRFLGFRRDVPDLIASADLVVLPSVTEAFGLALIEALYLGTPVVATRVGGIPEIVDDGVDGVLVPPADSQALTDAIVALLSDPERRLRMTGMGRDKVLKRFRFEDMVRSYEAVYRQLTAGVE